MIVHSSRIDAAYKSMKLLHIVTLAHSKENILWLMIFSNKRLRILEDFVISMHLPENQQ